MRIKKLVGLTLAVGAAIVFVVSGTLYAGGSEPSGAKVTTLMQKPLPDLPGKEFLIRMIEFAPGHIDTAHRHDAHVFVYVLEGTIEMQVKDGQPVTLKAGGTFYENPDDVHPLGRNLSKTRPAKFLVFFVKDQNTPAVLPVTKKAGSAVN